MSIESNPLLDVHGINTDSAYLLFGDSSDETFSIDAKNLLSHSDVKLNPKYFVKSLLLDNNLRQSSLDKTAFLNHPNLFAYESRFYCKVDFIVDMGSSSVSEDDGELLYNKTVNLPSMLIYKQHGSNFIYSENFEQKYTLSNHSSLEVIMSRLRNSNHDYNLHCLLSTTRDSISFSYISYAKNKIFNTRINFTFASFSAPLTTQPSGSVFQAPIWNNSEETIDVLDNSLSLIRLSDIDDGGDPVTYSLSGSDASNFNLNENTGTIGFKQRPLFDQKNLYTVDLTATNSIGSATISLSINIVDVDYTVVILDGSENIVDSDPDIDDPPASTEFGTVVSETLQEDESVTLPLDEYVELANGTASLQTASGTFSSGAVFEPGESITLIPLPDSGFEFVEWRVDDINLDIVSNSFIMPRAHVAIRPIFREIQ